MLCLTGSQGSYIYSVGVMKCLDELDGLLADAEWTDPKEMQNRLDEARALIKMRMAALQATEEIMDNLDNGHRLAGTIWKAFYTMVEKKMETHRKLTEDEKRVSQIHSASETTIRDMVDDIKQSLLEKVHSEAKMNAKFQKTIEGQKSKVRSAPTSRGRGGGGGRFSQARAPYSGGRNAWHGQQPFHGNGQPFHGKSEFNAPRVGLPPPPPYRRR